MSIERLQSIKEPFCLVLTDCAQGTIIEHLSEKIENLEVVRVQGGIGWDKMDWCSLGEYCKYSMILNSWANAFSVVPFGDYWNTRWNSCEGIIRQLSSFSKLLVLDRPGSLDKYWESGEFNKHVDEKDLGVPLEKARSLGWNKPNTMEQICRRVEYYSKLNELRSENQFQYYDMIRYPVSLARSAEDQRNVVNSAPWHYDKWLIEMMTESFLLFIEDELSEDYFISWKPL